MFSITVRRSAATLGVVAGLLAAAVPASAQIAPGTMGVKAPGPSANVPAQISIGTAEVFELNTLGGNDTLRANSGEVAVESVTHLSEQGWGTTYLNAEPRTPLVSNGTADDVMYGTQIGSEGVKAPTKAADRAKYYLENAWPSKVEISALTGSNAPRANLNDVEAIDFNALGTQVGSEGVKTHTRLEWPLIDY